MDQEGFGNGSAANKRQPKPEEQALVDEFAILSAQHADQFPHICQFLQKETNRISKGHKSLEEEHFLDIESGKPVRLTYKVSVPVEKYPNFNYVGRLLGPKGSTLKGMQEISGCKLAILGRGSMRDKAKEEQCRQEGGKYSHLNEDLHVWIQAFGPPDMAFYKLYVAAKEVKKYLHADYNDEIFTEQMMVLEQEGSLPPGYTASRAVPRGRGGRGMMRGSMSGRGGMGGSMGRGSASRGGGMLRGGARGRGNAIRGSTVRGGRGSMHRGGASGSGVSADTLYEDVYEPAPQAFKSEYENGSSSLGGGGISNAYFDEFPEPRTGGGGDGIGYQRQSHGGYGGSSMASSGYGMEPAGVSQSGMEGASYMSHGSMGGMKRGMDGLDHPVKYPRRY